MEDNDSRKLIREVIGELGKQGIVFRRRFWLSAVTTFMAGLISGLFLMYVINPHIAPRLQVFFNPRGSLYVSVTYKDVPGEEVSGSELSQLILLKPGDERDVIVDTVDPQKGSHKWDNLKPGRYVVEVYINDMYAGKTNEMEIRSRDKPKREIVTELAPSKIQIKVVSSDGTTPLEGAIVEVLSHRGSRVGSGEHLTDSDGETREIWISRTTRKNEHYYIYVYQKKDSKRSLITSSEEVRVDRPVIKETIKVKPE